MPEQYLSFKDFSLSPTDLLPPADDDDLDEDDHQWQDYCAEASHVNRRHILDAVLSSLDTDDSPLYQMIDSCLKEPQEPGRARESITVLAALGQALLDITAAAVDAQVNLRMMTQEVAR